jgi:hypothetical protein
LRHWQVVENLTYAARLLMPAGTASATCSAAVREVVGVLGLGGVAHQVVGSPGERWLLLLWLHLLVFCSGFPKTLLSVMLGWMNQQKWTAFQNMCVSVRSCSFVGLW